MNAPRLFARLYLDEDVPVQVADILRGHGYDVRTAGDEGMLGTSDAEQARVCGGAGIGVRHT